MNPLLLYGVLLVFLATSVCQADTLPGNQAPTATLRPLVIKFKKDNGQSMTQDTTGGEFAHGLTDLKIDKVPPPPVVNATTPRSKPRISVAAASFAGEQVKPMEQDPLFMALNPRSTHEKYAHRESPGLLASVSPDYKRKGILTLRKIPTNRRREAIMFTFIMNKEKRDNSAQEKSEGILFKQVVRTRMHILWTGPKKMVQEQKLIENEYPVDLSIARYEDGYAPEEWNLVLPNKKPREVMVSLVWSF